MNSSGDRLFICVKDTNLYIPPLIMHIYKIKYTKKGDTELSKILTINFDSLLKAASMTFDSLPNSSSLALASRMDESQIFGDYVISIGMVFQGYLILAIKLDIKNQASKIIACQMMITQNYTQAPGATMSDRAHI